MPPTGKLTFQDQPAPTRPIGKLTFEDTSAPARPVGKLRFENTEQPTDLASHLDPKTGDYKMSEAEIDELKGPSLLDKVKTGLSNVNVKDALLAGAMAPEINTVRRAANITSASALAPIMRGLLKAGEYSPIDAAPVRKGAEYLRDTFQTAQEEPPTELENNIGFDLAKQPVVPYKPEYSVKGMEMLGINPNAKAAKIARGIIDPIAETASSLTVPANAALLGAGLGKGAGTVFAPMMIEGAVDQAKELPGAIAERDPYKIAKSLIGSTVSGSLGAAGLASDFMPKVAPVRTFNPEKYREAATVENVPEIKIASKETPVPETPETLKVQLDALKKRTVPAVLITEGEAMPTVPKGFKATDTEVGTFIHDPLKVQTDTIKAKVADGTHGEILGHLEPKSESTTQTVAAITPSFKSKQIDPTKIFFREETQNNILGIREAFPEGEGYFPIVVSESPKGSEIIDGHNRAAVAIERGDKIPAVSILDTSYKKLKEAGFDDIEIAFAALKRANESEAANALDSQFIGSNVFKHGGEALDLLNELELPKGIEAKTSIVSPDNVVPQAEILKQQFPDAEIKVGGDELAQKIINERRSLYQPINDYQATTGDKAIDSKIKKVIEMSPDEYLKKAFEVTDGQLGGNYKDWLASNRHTQETIEKYAEALKRGDKFPMVYIDEAMGAQDGRNRALAAKLAGKEKIPVAIIPEMTRDEKISWVESKIKESPEKSYARHKYTNQLNDLKKAGGDELAQKVIEQRQPSLIEQVKAPEPIKELAQSKEITDLINQAFLDVTDTTKEGQRGSISFRPLSESPQAKAKAARTKLIEIISNDADASGTSLAEAAKKYGVSKGSFQSMLNKQYEYSKGETARNAIQDNMNPVERIQKRGVITETADPYLAETLLHGRADARSKQVYDVASKIDSDIVKNSKSLGITPEQLTDEVNSYLQATHAPERNAVHGDGAAGMTNEGASLIIKDLQSKPYFKAIQESAAKIKQMSDQTLDVLLESGILSKEKYDELRTIYKEHVPLNRVFEEGENIVDVIGSKGLDVRSSGLKRAKGSQREVADILTNVVTNLSSAIVRAEKNKVDLNTLAFARNNKNLGLFEEIKPKAIGQDFKGKILKEKIDNPQILQMFENGKPVYLKVNEPTLAAALKGINVEKLPDYLKYVGEFTRLYSSLATRFNPEFVFSNKIRDLQEMFTDMASRKGIGFKGATKALLKDPSSTKAIFDSLRGKETPNTKLYKQMIMDGGTTGGLGLSTRSQIEVDMAKIRQLNRSNPRKAAEMVLKSVDKWNQIFEDSTRLSVYRSALDRGLSRKRAAFLAKESTINFNRKGKYSPITNAIWMFSNASIQGSTKMLRAMKNPKVAAAVIGGVGASVLVANDWNNNVDEDWKNKVSKYDRLNSLNIVLPSESGFKYISIPISWGLKPIKVGMEKVIDVSNGDTTPADATKELLATVIEGYNPVGGTDLGSALMPTAGDIPFDIARNKKWSGSMIRPDFDRSKPEHEKFFKSLGDTDSGKAFIKGTDELSKAGIEISPADAKYVYDSLIGGAGRFITKTLDTGSALSKGELPRAKDTPGISKFYREKTQEELDAEEMRTFLSGTKTENKFKEPYFDELKRVSEAVDKPIAFTDLDKSVSKKITAFKERVSPAKFETAKQEYGRILKEKINKVIKSPNYRLLSDEGKHKLFSDLDQAAIDEVLKDSGFKYKKERGNKRQQNIMKRLKRIN